MPAVAPELRISYADYLALEQSTDTRHEFYDGRAWAMAGGTLTHSAVKSNVLSAFHAALEGKPCREYDADAKVYVEATGLATYPDLSVVCGPVKRASVDANALTNPTVIVEVLSPSTADWDIGGKFAHYMRIESLREVLFITPETRAIQQRVRNDDGSWLLRDLDPKVPIVLRSLDASIRFESVFEKLEEVGG